MEAQKTAAKSPVVSDSLPDIIPAASDEQVVVLRKGNVPVIKGGRLLEGPVVETRGGIGYVVGESRQLDFRGEKTDKVRRMLELEKLRDAGMVGIVTPAEVYRDGVNGDRTKLGIIFTSGGEASSIGVNMAEVVGEMGKTHVVLGAWQGFGSGVLKKDDFAGNLLVLNDPETVERIGHTGGSPLGMSRTKIKKDSAEETNLLDNVDGVGFVSGNGGGDHTKNFKLLYEKKKAEGRSMTVVVTPKSMDNDLRLRLADGTEANSLMLGYLTTAYVMRRHWFDELQSAAGNGKGVVGYFFSRGAGWTVLGATRCDEPYRNMLRDDGILTQDLDNKMDALGRRQIGLVPEYPVSIPSFVAKVNEVYNRGRDKTVGVAVSEGFMFTELDREYKRLTEQVGGGRLTEKVINEKIAAKDFNDLIEDENLRKVFKAKPDVAKEFFKLVVKPELDNWGHPYIRIMPKIVDAVVNVLTPVKTNYVEIKYEARTGETIPTDRLVGEETGRLAGQKIRAGESGVTTVTYKPGEDPLLLGRGRIRATFIPFEGITEMAESNNLLQLDREYVERCGILTG
jgi:6-phosphofructokinase